MVNMADRCEIDTEHDSYLTKADLNAALDKQRTNFLESLTPLRKPINDQLLEVKNCLSQTNAKAKNALGQRTTLQLEIQKLQISDQDKCTLLENDKEQNKLKICEMKEGTEKQLDLATFLSDFFLKD